MVLGHEAYIYKAVKKETYERMSMKSKIDVKAYMYDSGDESDEINQIMSLLYYKKTENLRNLKNEYEESEPSSSNSSSDGFDSRPRIVVNDPKDFLLDQGDLKASTQSRKSNLTPIKNWFNKGKKSSEEKDYEIQL